VKIYLTVSRNVKGLKNNVSENIELTQVGSFRFTVVKKVKLSLKQAVKVHRAVRRRGSHIF
jgi:hypothetical protein